ncbi:MAG: NUDIX hydrolase [bacterium]
MEEIRIRVAVLIIEEGKILLVQHHKDGRKYWLLPGGGVDYGETLVECAKREIREEANLEVEIEDLLFINESIPPDRHRHVLNLYFRGKITGGNLQIGQEPILDAIEFVDLSRLDSLTLYPNVKQEIKDLAAGIKPEVISLGNRWA